MALGLDTASLEEVVQALPPPAVLAMGTLVVLGAVLWLMGRRLARPACVVSGLVLGGIAGYVLGRALEDDGAMTLPLAVGAALAGALLSGLLFRIWMGFSGAALLALCVPAAVIVWQGTPAPAIDPQTILSAEEADDGEAAAEAEEAARDRQARRPQRRQQADREEAEPPDARPVLGVLEGVRETAAALYEGQAEAISAWWEELADETRWALRLAALIGAGLGLALGLIAPYTAASVQSALTGAILIYLPGRALAAWTAPDWAGWLPQSPRGALVVLGLITLGGVLIQWTLSRRRADK